MGFWPFGREPTDVEHVSRVVSALVGDTVRVRGKLTLHFMEPQTQTAADDVADRCASTTEAILREASDHTALLGGEAAIVAQLLSRLPAGIPAPRSVELAALHVVGSPGSTAGRQSISTLPPAAALASSRSRGRSSPGPSPIPAAYSPSFGSGSTSPPTNAAQVATLPLLHPRRVSSGRMRAITGSLQAIPRAASPQAMGAALSTLVRDSAGRLLVGTLRAHDLLIVRGLTLDEGSAEALAALVPVPEGSPGGYEATRAAEIARWQAALGPTIVEALRREVAVATAFLAHRALQRAELAQQLTTVIVESACATAFPEASVALEIGRYLHTVQPTVADELSTNLGRILGAPEKRASISTALSPLLAAIQEEIAVAATHVRQSAGL